MSPSQFLKVFEAGPPHNCLFKEYLLPMISKAYVRWLTGRFQDVVVIKEVSQVGMLLVVSPGLIHGQHLKIFLLVL